MSIRIFTPLLSSCSSCSVGSSSTRSSRYENPEHPPPLTPTRRRVLSSGRFWLLMISRTSAAAFSVSRMGMSGVSLSGGLYPRRGAEALDGADGRVGGAVDLLLGREPPDAVSDRGVRQIVRRP